MAAEKTDIANVVMEVHITCQKQSGGNHGGDHAGAMSGEFAAHNQAAANQQQNRARPVQTSDQGRKVGVLFRNHAAGFVVRRFTIIKQSANMQIVNRTNANIDVGREVTIGLAGYNNPRSASTP